MFYRGGICVKVIGYSVWRVDRVGKGKGSRIAVFFVWFFFVLGSLGYILVLICFGVIL